MAGDGGLAGLLAEAAGVGHVGLVTGMLREVLVGAHVPPQHFRRQFLVNDSSVLLQEIPKHALAAQNAGLCGNVLASQANQLIGRKPSVGSCLPFRPWERARRRSCSGGFDTDRCPATGSDTLSGPS
eukprot:scaffold1282_cov251-Pinguiococcus_pyrenoidosus.AAC.41